MLGRTAAGPVEIELESVDDTHLQLRSEWRGFEDAVSAMAARLSHMPTDWRTRIELLKPGHALWRRGWTIAEEKVGPDGTLATSWQRLAPEGQP